MTIKVGINGFGRIGRMVLRSIIENARKDVEIVAINNRGNNEVSSFLLKHDTIHGQLKAKVTHSDKSIMINDKEIQMSHETEISKINWKKYNIDVVLECTGKFNTKDKSAEHLKTGAKKVLVSAPCKGAKNIVFGVNQKNVKPDDKVISAASCTTNCLAPVAKIISDNFGVERGFMTTIHSYTSDQRLLDNSHKDLRRARSASNSMIPTTTGATKSLGEVVPELKGKVEGISIRVPTPNVSLVEFIFSSNKNLSSEKINETFIKASKSELKGILNISNEHLVSSDFNHDPHSAIVDLLLTKVSNEKMAKVSAWYDNEWGFANRMCDLAAYLGNAK
jgi:glyceraldehyde 3-phosphate dehydrogenase